jgi:serine/threonine protein kinase
VISEGLHIPGYDIEDLLGKGGMAAVYRARQQSFGREVALKVLNPAADDLAEFSRRFLQESLIVAKLHHSHIVQVYDVGQHEHYFYISMEYLHGGDLSTRLRAGTTLKESVTIIKQLADALDFAHRKNIIHRDIKPANVMFREDGAAVLTDFGVAKELESQTDLTLAGVVIGTPKYMSPEQVRGDKVDHRTDIYALGIVLFRCLTNYVPFDGKDMVSTAYLQDNEPVPTLPPEVACFQPIINRMLEKSPEDRFQRGRDILIALEEIERRVALPDLTNLDVAAASKAAPPSVTHSTSGRHPVRNPGRPNNAKGNHAPADGTQIRAQEPLSETLLADHIVPAESRLDLSLDEPLVSLNEPFVEAPSKARKSRSSAVLLGLVSLGALALPANLYSGKLMTGAWSDSIAVAGDRVLESWAQITGDYFTNTAATSIDKSKDPAVELKQQPLAMDPVSSSPTHLSPEPEESTNSAPAFPPAEIAIEQNQNAETAVEVAILSSSAGAPAAGVPATGSPAAGSPAAGVPATISTTGELPAAEIIETEQIQDDMAAASEIDPSVIADEQTASGTATVIARLLAEAEANMAQRHMRTPTNNARLKFQQVLELDNQNTEALAGMEQIASTYIAMADQAISQQQLDKSRKLLEEIRAIAPQRSELNTLEEKLFLAIAAKEHEATKAAAQQRAAQIEELLSAARSDEQAGRIRTPFGNNALEKYQHILELDPDNSDAIDKLIEYGR